MSPPPRPQSSEPSPAEPKVQIAQSIDELDDALWDEVVRHDTLFLQRRYLRALEPRSGPRPRYALVTDVGQPIAVARFELAHFVGRPMHGWLSGAGQLGARLASRLGLSPRALSVPLVVCGSPFTTGRHGFALAAGVPAWRGVRSLVLAMDEVERELGREGGTSGLLVKDFVDDGDPGAWQLGSHSFSAISTAPSMVMRIDPTWTSFDDYLASLSSKFRVKAKRAYAKSANLLARPLSADELARRRERVESLHDAVLERAEYRLGRFAVDGLVRLREALGDELFVVGYFLGDELVGFASGLVDGGRLEAHLVGIDYARNRDHAIYCRMLYDYVREAIDRRLELVNFGRTAEEIKSSVGAVPVGMTCYVRHRERHLNELLPTLARLVRRPPTALREPFRRAWQPVGSGGGPGSMGEPDGSPA